MAIKTNPCFLTATQLLGPGELRVQDSALYAHYNSYNPKTLYDIYGTVPKLKDHSFDCIFLPWIHNYPLAQLGDVAFIRRDLDFIKKQIKKIQKLIASIKENGYNPDLFLDRKGGNITGYFIKNGNMKKFYVVSGNHRASVLSAMFPSAFIPVARERREFAKPRDLKNRTAKFLEVYDSEDVNHWPSVKSGFLTANEAISIMRVYLNA
tara:strand:- start:5613 stop:6236 length:624 start_codon:yes stop_codon:yes gene_type:complete